MTRPMTVRNRLTHDQLVIVMHVANGLTLEEIAEIMHYSVSNVSYHLGQARRRCHANNLPHLVSIAIATGDLVWEDNSECRVISSPTNGIQRSGRV